jgi:hypothetical protein
MGGYLRRPCPLGCGYPVSLWQTESGWPRARCYGGCEEDEVLTAVEICGEDELPIVARPTRADDERRRKEAGRIYAEAGAGSLVPTYLHEARAISLLPPGILREHLHCPHRLNIRLPAMVAPVVDTAGAQTGIHMTYLRPDGSGKADFPNRDLQRECRGIISGGSIRLEAHDPDRDLIVAEGIETTLSAMQIFNLPGWSAVCAGGLRTIELPLEIRRVVIAADHDLSGAGQRNALAARERWRSEGRVAEIAMPPTPGGRLQRHLEARVEWPRRPITTPSPNSGPATRHCAQRVQSPMALITTPIGRNRSR